MRRLASFATDLSTLGAIVEHLALRPGEELIGVYQNPPMTAAVVVTSFGLHAVDGTASRYVPFALITRVDGPSDKDERASDLVLCLADGERVLLPIRGERGQFKDAFEFQRFLVRVIDDQS